uniref:Glucose dehydrogenase [FAD, quinone] n=1 Tax=Cacopsylla melanoneura TaxID=428564 RepID=A0A8D8X2I1_9HEMI
MAGLFNLTLSLLYFLNYAPDDPTGKPEPPLPEEFDFVIIGAGTSGSILASRLAEVSSWKILLVEAGGDPLNISYFPEQRGKLYQSSMDWNFVTEEQSDTFLSLTNQRSRIPCGKGLGGSSSIHSLYYTRGDARDYDEWGYETLKFDNVLKYFKKSEFMTDTSKVNKFHGTQGPFIIKPSPRVDKTFDIVGKTLEERYHVKHLTDTNTGSTLGYSHYDLYMDTDGKRVSSYTAYIKNRSKRKRNNLYILKNSEAVRILMKDHETPDKVHGHWCGGTEDRNNIVHNTGDSNSNSNSVNSETNYNSVEQTLESNYNVNKTRSAVDTIVEEKLRVSTVEIRIGNLTAGKLFHPKVTKEIILSAGTINTPKILMNSGIGPTAPLLKKNIRLVKRLPVGENYWDHVHFQGLLFRTNDGMTEDETRYGGGAGILMSLLDDPARPNVEYQVNKFSKGTPVKQIITDLNNPAVEAQLNTTLAKYSVVRITPALVRPKSRGRVILGEYPTTDYPLIQGEYLKDPEDMFVMVDAILKIEQLQNVPEFKKNGFDPIILNYSPSCNSSLHTHNPSLYWACALTHLASSNWHPMGTCSLGQVVDDSFLVNSFDNLRVADASVIPVMSGHPNAAVALIAEYVADQLKAKYNSASGTISRVAVIMIVTIMTKLFK